MPAPSITYLLYQLMEGEQDTLHYSKLQVGLLCGLSFRRRGHVFLEKGGERGRRRERSKVGERIWGKLHYSIYSAFSTIRQLNYQNQCSLHMCSWPVSTCTQSATNTCSVMASPLSLVSPSIKGKRKGLFIQEILEVGVVSHMKHPTVYTYTSTCVLDH